MYKHLPKSFQIELALITICRQTLILLVGTCLGLMLWQWVSNLGISQTIYTSLQGLPFGVEIRIVMGISAILLLLLLSTITINVSRLMALFSPIIVGEYPLSYHFNWPIILLYVIILCVIEGQAPNWTIPAAILLDVITLIVLLKDRKPQRQVLFSSQKGAETNENKNLLKDTPISSLNEDSLGRKDFVDTFYRILKAIHNSRNVILLNGAWGQGKTSVLNCVESYAKGLAENQLIFRWVNPWQNDTKERFVATLLEEINLFLQYTPPMDSISPSLLKRLSFSVQPFPWLNISFPSASSSHNIEVNIRELSDKLKRKQNRLVIIVDDLDRLNKQQILDILASVYLFSECHNIIFVLAANVDKVEALLTESQSNEKPGEIHSYYKAYQGYLEKIATNIVPLPDILPEKLRKYLIEQVENPKNNIPFSKEAKKHIPEILFHNLRDVKRLLQAFSNVMQQTCVQEEVNSYHMLLVTYLHVFALKVYENISQHPSFWIKEEIDKKIQGNGEKDEPVLTYFNHLIAQYPDQKEKLQKVFSLLNPGYQTALIKQKEINLAESLYQHSYAISENFSYRLPKAFFHPNYFYKYFTHQPDTYTIPDKKMRLHIEELTTLPPKNGAKEVANFLTLNKITQLSSYFSYLRNNVSFKGNEKIYNTIANGLCLLLNDDNVQFDIKKLIIEEHIPQWIRQGNVSNDSIINIFNRIHSILFKTYIHYTAGNNNIDLFKQLQMPAADSYTAEEILKEEDKYSGFSYSRSLLYSWMRNWEHNAQYNAKRKKAIIKIFEQNEYYFWLAVGKDLHESLDSHFPNILREKITSWGILTIQNIISILLKMPCLEHREELVELQTALKNLLPKKEAPRNILQ